MKIHRDYKLFIRIDKRESVKAKTGRRPKRHNHNSSYTILERPSRPFIERARPANREQSKNYEFRTAEFPKKDSPRRQAYATERMESLRLVKNISTKKHGNRRSTQPTTKRLSLSRS